MTNERTGKFHYIGDLTSSVSVATQFHIPSSQEAVNTDEKNVTVYLIGHSDMTIPKSTEVIGSG